MNEFVTEVFHGNFHSDFHITIGPGGMSRYHYWSDSREEIYDFEFVEDILYFFKNSLLIARYQQAYALHIKVMRTSALITLRTRLQVSTLTVFYDFRHSLRSLF